MEEIYLKIWNLAKPYYKKGRSYDISHIEWMTERADKISDSEGLDKKILLPTVILHDVGYSAVGQQNPNIKDKESKALHMKEGSLIAEKILNKVNYDQELSKKIINLISVHDNWIFGDDKSYKEIKEMALLNDLDFLWATTDFDIFEFVAKSINMSPQDFYTFLSNDEKLTRRPFCCEDTKSMWEEYMLKIKKLLNS